MKAIIELNEKDMEGIIAAHFNVEKEKVSVSVREECSGYGLGEHIVFVPTCTVEKEG